ncbi:uncharacterized protein F4822DRAFT_434968 [Hypoxylon trugodes]|uniref:uncharacterized protein n=1 Tax=Hypoxylon trugodes TaxID=326681 RepID=UPI00218F5FB2|nr:uncharacterized protein F4822DRAFT_434968 [Hypoxylon trugodes]KAI1383043.1 hypothetical protein F4822DRAFT_434968 [Hypoxylon trugodes]
MSGFEIVGTVLGAIPLIISVIRNYQKVSEYRDQRRILEGLARDLDIESTSLRNTCMSLLEEVAPPSELRTMHSAFPELLWENDNVRLRVESRVNCTGFLDIVRDMEMAIEELKKKLKLGPQCEVKSPKSKSMSLVINRSVYEKDIEKLRSRNLTLKFVLMQGSEFESRRQKRSHCNWMGLLQATTQDVYDALRPNLCRTYSHSQQHGVSLGLFAEEREFWMRNEVVSANRLEFHLTLSYHLEGTENSGNYPWDWKKKGVRFQSTVTKESSTPSPSDPTLRVQISNLCEDILYHKDCYGHLISKRPISEDGRFGVYRSKLATKNNSYSLLSLEQAIGNCNSQPSLTKKLSLASIITSSILKLYGAPWLPRYPISKNIRVVQDDNTVDYGKVIPDEFISQNCAQDHTVHLSKTFDCTTSSGIQNVELFLRQVKILADDQYRNAVKNCLKLAIGSPDLDLNEDKARDEIYNNIIAPVEESFMSSDFMKTGS